MIKQLRAKGRKIEMKVYEYPKEENFIGVDDGLPIMQVEKYGVGFIIADYRQEGIVSCRGKSNNWIEGSSVVEDPFSSEEEAQEALENKKVTPMK
jgi:hypothetical protein